MSSSAMPPGGLPKRGAPGVTGPAPSKDKQPADSTWPLPRQPNATTDITPPAGKKQRPPEAEVPLSTGAAKFPNSGARLDTTNVQPPPLRGLPSEKKLNARPNGPGPDPESMGGEIPILIPPALNLHQGKNNDKTLPPLNTKTQPGKTAPSFSLPRSAGPNGPVPVPESTGGEIPILAPPALDTRQAKNTSNAPPPLATKTQPDRAIPSFSFPRSAGPKDNKDAPQLPEPQASKPLRAGPSGPVPVPTPLSQTAPAASRQPPVPDSLRPGPKVAVPPAPDTTRPGPSVTSSRSEQPALDGLRPGAAHPGQKLSPFPERPGPAPSGPVPTPSKSSRKNTAASNLSVDQDTPPPLRLGKQASKAQQSADTASIVPPVPVPNSKEPITSGKTPSVAPIEPLKLNSKEPNANGRGVPPPPRVDNMAPRAHQNANPPSMPAISTQNIAKESKTARQETPFTPLNASKYNPKETGTNGKNVPSTPLDPSKPDQKESGAGVKGASSTPQDPLKPNPKQHTNPFLPMEPPKLNPKESSASGKGKNAPLAPIDPLDPSKAAVPTQLRPGQVPTTNPSRAGPADSIPRKPLGSPPRPSQTNSPRIDPVTFLVKPKTSEQQKLSEQQKMSEQQKGTASTNPFRRSRTNAQTQAANAASMNPLGSSPPNPQVQPYNEASTKPLNLPPQSGSQPKTNPPIYRPSVRSPPPRTQTTSNFAPPPTGKNKQAPSSGFSSSRPGAAYAGGPSHGHSSSIDSNVSNDSVASSSTATSTRPLNPTQRQNTGFANKPARQASDPREKGAPGGGGYYSSGNEAGAAESPYMNMLLSLDRIPRMHNILVSFFVWILLAGFVIIPGSFTSSQRKQEGETVQLPVSAGGTGTGADAGGGKKLSLTPANTAALVIGFVCIIAGTFGSAWLALRWRRNYVWLLNKLYLPLILNALAGLLATITSVYTQQAGEWGPQAVTTAVVEAVILAVSVILFFVYNYWLLKRMRSDHEEAVTGGKEKKKKKKEKESWRERRARKKREKKEGMKRERKVGGGWFGRWKQASKKKPYAAGSVV